MKNFLALIIFSISIFASANEITLYHGLATTHLFQDNTPLNNNNGVTIIKYNDWFAGGMTNSYKEPGYLFGWQPQVLEHKKWSVDLGVTAVWGYRRWQLDFFDTVEEEKKNEKIWVAFPIASVRRSVGKVDLHFIEIDFKDRVSFQVNSMGTVINAGLRISI